MKSLILAILLISTWLPVNAQIDNYSINGNKVFIFKIGHFIVYKDGTYSLQTYQTIEEGEVMFKLNFDGSFTVMSSKIQLNNSQNYIASLITLLNDKQISGNISTLKATKIENVTISYTGDKVTRIGNTSIFYTGDKVIRIGNTSIFYTGDKVIRIGDISIFYTEDKVTRIGDTSFFYTGDKVSRIGNTVLP
ncbi:hypothetical protein [Spirosoma foliorum]|uniref:Organic solvent tolerance-like N-terminal domain-containing protein n=1 Tax=Spirosoma foliorum TaxID=2710596 RepID=A0A7G5GS87_9BACT|nr:hypothetical protein [Spirosoma foliorum]QMW01729.1 hypothetical protein H3H32_27850 [Spirosoma foliorum]